MYNFVNLGRTSKKPSILATLFSKDAGNDKENSKLFNRTSLWHAENSFHEKDTQPKIKTLSYVLQELRGIRPKGLEGAIVNFNATRTFNAKDPSDLEWGAHRLLEDGEVSGSHYATISRSGTIYLPIYWNWLDYGFYAESGQCPITKRRKVSKYYVGLEVNSPGIAYATKQENQFIACYDAKKDAQGQIILENGFATPIHSNVEYFDISEVWDISKKMESETPYYFIPYTKAQQMALINLFFSLKIIYPKSFRYEYLFGYDEICCGVEHSGGYSGLSEDLYSTPEAKIMAELRAFMLKN